LQRRDEVDHHVPGRKRRKRRKRKMYDDGWVIGDEKRENTHTMGLLLAFNSAASIRWPHL